METKINKKKNASFLIIPHPRKKKPFKMKIKTESNHHLHLTVTIPEQKSLYLTNVTWNYKKNEQ